MKRDLRNCFVIVHIIYVFEALDANSTFFARRRENVTLSCPSPTTVWLIWQNNTVVNDGVRINPSLSSYSRLTAINDTTKNSIHLHIQSVTDIDVAVYTCTFTANNTDWRIQLSLYGDSKSTLYAERRGNITLSCPSPTRSWSIYQNSTVINDGLQINPSLPSYDRLTAINDSTRNSIDLHIRSVTDIDESVYRCVFTEDNTNWDIQLFLYVEPDPPVILNTVQEGLFIEGTVGKQIIIVCHSFNGNPSADVTWKTGTANLATSKNSVSYRFTPTRINHLQNFTCVSNSAALSNPLQVSVQLFLELRPIVEIKPSFARAIEGDTGFTLTCVVTNNNSSPNLFVWWRNSSVIGRSQNYSINTVSRNDAGSYSCSSTNDAGTSDPASSTLTVLYPPEIDTIADKSPEEGSSFTVVCTITSSNPAPDRIYWTRRKDPSFRNDGSLLSILSVSRDDTDIYTCHAENTMVTTTRNVTGRSERDVVINVLCSPLPVDGTAPLQKVVVGLYRNLNITFLFTANPSPTGDWLYDKENISDNGPSDSNRSTSELRNIDVGTYRTSLLKRNITYQDYGVYVAKLLNSRGQTFLPFYVVREGKPDSPHDLSIACNQPNKVMIYWTPGFNGLDMDDKGHQVFQILYKREEEANFTSDTKEIKDNGGRLSGVVDNLPPGRWTFTLRARNEFGSTNASSSLTCLIPAPKDEEKASFHGGSFGAGIGVMVAVSAIIVGVMIFFWRREVGQCTQTEKSTKQSSNTALNQEEGGRMYEEINKTEIQDSNYSRLNSSVNTQAQNTLDRKFITIGASSCIAYQPFVLGENIISVRFGELTICTSVVQSGTNVYVIPDSYKARMNCTVDRGTNTVTFCLNNTTKSDAGVYTLFSTGASNFNRSGLVNVMDRPTLPSISPTSAEELKQVILTCSSTSTSAPSPTGLAMLYTWTADGAAPVDQRYIVTTNKLTINTVQRGDMNRVFQCRAREENGLPSDRANVSLSVIYRPVVSTSGNVSASEGSTVQISCIVLEANPSTILRYIWYKSTDPSVTLTINRTLTLAPLRRHDYGLYNCKAENSVGSSLSPASAEIIVQFGPDSTSISGNKTLNENSMLMLTCSASTSYPQSILTWLKDGIPFSVNSPVKTSNGMYGGITTSQTLTLIAKKQDNGANITCVASTTNKVERSTVFLNVRYKPTVQIIPTNIIVIVDEMKVVLTCSVTDANPYPHSFIWMRNTTVISVHQNYSIPVVSRENAGLYSCMATNVAGLSDSANMSVDVLYPPKIANMSKQTPEEGSSITLPCIVTSSNPPPQRIYWTRRKDPSFIVNGSILSITSMKRTDTDVYICNAESIMVSSTGKTVTSVSKMDVIIDVLCPPQPLNSTLAMERVVVGQDNSLNITFQFTGSPLPTVSLIFDFNNNSSIENNPLIQVEEFDIGKYKTSILKNLTNSDFGLYVVQLQNSLGQKLVPFRVTQQGKPDSPNNLFLDCSEPNKATLYWTPGFNGLAKTESGYQTFQILYKSEPDADFITDTNAIKDNGGRVSGIVGNLASKNWTFSLLAKNAFGITAADSSAFCSVNAAKSDEGRLLFHGGSFGAGIGLTVGVIAIPLTVMVVIWRKRVVTCVKMPNSTQKTRTKTDIDDSGRMYEDIGKIEIQESNYSQLGTTDDTLEYVNTSLSTERGES